MSGQLKSQSGVVRRIASLAARPTAAEFGIGSGLIVDPTKPGYRVEFTCNGESFVSHGYSDSITDRPSAAALGMGSWQVGYNVYVSDGAGYTLPSNGKYPTLKWDAVLSKLKLGTGNAKVMFLGDSTGLGAWATGSAFAGNLMKDAFRKQKALMSTPSSVNSFIGNSGTDLSSGAMTNFLLYDTRFTADADWTTGYATLGGLTVRNITASTTSIHFLPTTEFDTIEVYYNTAPTNYGSFTVDIGAGVLATQSCIAATGFGKVTVPCTLGVNTVNINKIAAGWIQILGVNCYKNNSEIQLLNASYNGIPVDAVFGTIQPNAQEGIRTILPDLSIIDLGINDSTVSTDITTFNTKYQAIIDTCLESGDVALCVPNVIANTNKDIYYDAIRSLSIKNNLNLIDFDKRMGGAWGTANTLGLMSDGRHPLEAGYNIMADELYKSGIIAK